MNNKYLQHIASCEITSAYSYKILLLLLTKSYTQAQISELLQLQKQNTAKYFKELQALNLIEIDRTEGKNKFFRAVTNLEKLNTLIPGQTQIKL